MPYSRRKESNHTPDDHPRIDIHNGENVNYWTRKLGCTLLQLQLAVRRVGANPVDVEKHLRRW